MAKYLIVATLLIVAVTSFGCANPASNKTQATVGEASQEANPKPAGAETLVILPDNSKIEFVAAKVTRSHNGSFKQFNGAVDLVNNAVEQSRVTIDIDAASVVTDEDDLTKHLKTPDFFDVSRFPKATFTSTKIESTTTAGATHTVTGNFELHGVKKAITFPANIQLAPDKVTVSAEFAINRKDFGITYPGKTDDLIRDGVVIKLTLSPPRKR